MQNTDDYTLLENKTVIETNYGVGLSFTDEDGKKWKSVCTEDPRIVTLRTSSYRGLAWDAIHYYGRLDFSGLGQIPFKAGKKAKVLYTGGICDKFKPKEMDRLIVELNRKLTVKEVKTDKKRWEYFKAGNWTTCFNTEEEVIERGKEIFEKCFGKGWKLEIDSL